MRIDEAIQKRIIELCNKQNISVYKLAQDSCLTQSTLNSLLHRDNSHVSVRVLWHICKGFNISVIDFFNSDLFDNIEDDL